MILRRLLQIILMLLILGFSTLLFFIYSPTGLNLAIKYLNKNIPGLSIQQASGFLNGPIKISNLNYHNEKVHFEIKHADLQIDCWSLLEGLLKINKLHVTGVNIKILRNDNNNTLDINSIFPIASNLHNVEIKQIRIKLAQFAINIDKILIAGYLQTNKINLLLNWQGISSQCKNMRNLQSPYGKLQIDGSIKHYTSELNTKLTNSLIKATYLDLQLEGEKNAVVINKLSIHNDHGVLDANAHFSWAPTISWLINAKAHNLNPAIIWSKYPGKISFLSSSKGSNNQNGIDASIMLRDIKGQLRNKVITGILQASVVQSKLHELISNISIGSAKFKANGKTAKSFNLDWTLAIPNLNEIIPAAQGNINSQGKLQQNTSQLSVDAKFVANALSIPKIPLQSINLSINSINNQQSIKGKVNTSQQQVEFVLLGNMNNNIWQGQLKNLHVNYGRFSLQTDKSSNLMIGRNIFKADSICLNHQQVCLSGWKDIKRWHLALSTKNLDSKALMPILDDWQFNSKINGSLTFSQLANNELQGHADFSFSSGSINYLLFDQNQLFILQNGKLTANLNNQGLTAATHFDFNQQQFVQANINMTNFAINNIVNGKQSIQGNIQAHFSNLSFADKIYQKLRNAQGIIEAKLQLAGTISQPNLSGNIILKNGMVDVPGLKLNIKPINVVLSAIRPDYFKIDGKLKSGNNFLNLNGDLNLGRLPFGEINLSGNNILISNLPESKILATPNLKILLHNKQLNITGTVTIPKATIQPKDFSNSVVTADDIQIVNVQQSNKPKEPIPVTSQFDLIVGNEVYLNFVGLSAHLTGQLSILDKPDTLAVATGSLKAIDGSYNAYGQKLKLRHGYLVFTGGPMINPGIDVQASKTITNATHNSPIDLSSSTLDSTTLMVSQTPSITVGINVQNTLQKPVVTLFSEPMGLSQADILSYLLFGQPSKYTSKADSQVLFQAASALNISGSATGISSITKELQNTFGLSDLGVESAAEFNKDNEPVQNTSVVLGKYLTPRLYVNYSIGLLQPINIFRIRYILTKNWNLQAENNSIGMGLDLFYTIERK